MQCSTFSRATLGIIVALFTPMASAQILQMSTFVSENGSPANVCINAQDPCQTLNQAYNYTRPGGQIMILDSGQFLGKPLIITKPISIYAVAVSAYLATGVAGDYITVNAPANAVVYLDGLRLIADASEARRKGIVFNGGAQLHIRNCWIHGFGTGIRIEAPGSSKVIISNCRIYDNTFGISAKKNGGSGPLTVLVHNTTLTANNHAVYADGGGTHIQLDESRIVGNHHGIRANGNGRLISYGNNVITRNATNGQPTHHAQLR